MTADLLERGRVLVIDDSTTLRKLVEIAMRGSGCAVEFAATGTEGVSRARSAPPDVILLDYLLPDLESTAVCRELAGDAATARVPVVVMSANQRSVLDDFRPFATVVDFVGKPFTGPEVRARLESAMRGRRAAPPPPVVTAASTGPLPVFPLAPPAGGLQLAGDLAAVPLADVVRLLHHAGATGALVIERPAGTAWIHLRRGQLLLCADAPDGKPAAVALAEAGRAGVTDLPAVLHARSTALLGELLDGAAGRFAWRGAPIVPDFVEAFGRPIAWTALALGRARRAASPAAASPESQDDVYARTPRFSERLAGVRLEPDEQRVLALVDGRLAVRELAARADLPAARVTAVLARLAIAELVTGPGAGPGPETAAAAVVAVADPDGERFVAPLRAYLQRRPQPLDVVELEPGPLAAAVARARPRVLLLHHSRIPADSIAQELERVHARGVITVAVLDRVDPRAAQELLRRGFHAVLAKPFHVHELERVLGP